MMTLTSTQLGQLAAQFFLAGAGTLSFAVLFACPKRTLPCCALVGAVGWFIYELAILYGAEAAGGRSGGGDPPDAGGAYLRRATQGTGDGLFADRHLPAGPRRGHLLHRLLFHPGRECPSLANGISTFKVAVALAVGIALVLGLPMPKGHRWKSK